MINFIKPEALSKQELEQLVHLNNYWEKDACKVVKKLNKWLFKFAAEGKGYLKLINEEENITEQLFSNAINFANFYNIKIDKIKTNGKILKKFTKMISETAHLMAICGAVKIIANFYITIEKENVANKRNLAVNLLNAKTFKVFESAKAEILSQIKDDDYLNLTFKEAVVIEGKVFESKIITIKILTYLKLLMKHKKITESNQINCNYALFMSENFSGYLKYYLQNFINNIY